MNAFGSSAFENPLNLWIFLFIGFVAAVDFFIGSAGRKKIQSKLEDLWISYDDVGIKNFGKKEAEFTLGLFDYLFSSRFFSFRRFMSAAVLVLLNIVVFYLMIESYRWYNGLAVRLPFSEFHFYTGFPGTIIPTMISLSLTRNWLYISIRGLKDLKWSNFMFLTSLVILSCLSYLIYAFDVGPAMSEAISQIFVFFQDVILTTIKAEINTQMIGDRLSMIVNRIIFNIHGILNGDLYSALSYGPTAPFSMALKAETPSDYCDIECIKTTYGYLQIAYTQFNDLMLFLVRIILTFSFLVFWFSFGFLHNLTSTLLYRLAESEKGPLTLIAAAIAACIKCCALLIGIL